MAYCDYIFSDAGYVILENIMDKNNHIHGALNFDLSLADLIAIGMRCNSIFSLRSGLCDIFACRGEKLYVLWPKSRFDCSESFFRFSSCYNLQKNEIPKDFVLERNCTPEIIWNHKNISAGIKNAWLPKSDELSIILKLVILLKDKGMIYVAKKFFNMVKEKLAEVI